MAKRKASRRALGSNFDEVLAADGLLEEVTAVAVKRVIAWQLAEAMKEQAITKRRLAELMHTSRSHLDRLLDANDAGLTLETLSRAAHALKRRLKIELEAA